MRFSSLVTYARQRRLNFEQIALREIVLFSGGEFGYRETHILTDGGWWVDSAILFARW